MTSLEFFVPGNPVAQPRLRAVRRGKHAGVYDPGTADKWKASVKWCAEKALTVGKAILEPMRLTLIFTFQAPKKRTGGWHAYHAQKPDLDNLTKAAMDAMTDAGIWRDDALVCECIALKRWADPDTEPGLTVGIEVLPS